MAVRASMLPVRRDDGQEDEQDQDQREDDHGHDLTRIFGFEQLGQLAHHKVHLLGGCFDVIVELLQHLFLRLELLVDVRRHVAHTVDGQAQLFQVLILLVDDHPCLGLLVVDVVRVLHLRAGRGPKAAGRSRRDGFAFVGQHFGLDLVTAEGGLHLVEHASNFLNVRLALLQLVVVNVRELQAVLLHEVHGLGQGLELLVA